MNSVRAQHTQSFIDHASSAIKNAACKSGHLADDVQHGVRHAYQDAKHVARRDFGNIQRQIRESRCRRRLSQPELAS